MKQSLHPSLTSIYMWKICGIAKLLVVHFPSYESVSPNSPIKDPAPCSLSRYLTIDENGNQKCSRCSVCPKGFQVNIECSLNNDTVCEPCPSGWYNDVSGSNCTPCSGCRPGEYIRRDCSEKRDTVCRSCPNKSFSTQPNARLCNPCRRCNLNEKTLAKCDVTKDTVCGDCKNGYFRVSSTGSCVACSPCPTQLKHLVVPECRDKLGIHHPDICWPSYNQFRYRDHDQSSSIERDTTDTVHAEERNSVGEVPFIFIVIIFCVILCCFVLMIIVFVVLRLLPFRRHLNTEQTVAGSDSRAAIPMLPAVANSCDNAKLDSTPMTYSARSSTDSIFRSNTSVPYEEGSSLCYQESSFSEFPCKGTQASICELCEDTGDCYNCPPKYEHFSELYTVDLMTSSANIARENSDPGIGII